MYIVSNYIHIVFICLFCKMDTLKDIPDQQTTGLKRNTIDKYYTSDNAVKQCMEKIRECVSINPDDLCIEPCAGRGAFIPSIKTMFNHYQFYDIDPSHSEVKRQNYFNFDVSSNILSVADNHPAIHVIGNPPFGRQSSHAVKFIKKSAEYCDSISFILPRSFKKNSMRKRFPPRFHLVHEHDIPEDAFVVNDASYNVPCIFQVWVKRDTDREMPVEIEPRGYIFVKKSEDHDICIRRVGVYAGKIDRATQDKSDQSHYFVKFDKELTEPIYEKLDAVEFSGKTNTVGPRSISKPEVIAEYNQIIP